MFSAWHGYEDFNDLARRTASDKFFRDKAFNIAKNPNYDEYQRGLASMVYKFFDKKSAGSVANMHSNNECHFDLKSYTNQLFEILKKGLFIRDLKTMSGVLI